MKRTLAKERIPKSGGSERGTVLLETLLGVSLTVLLSFFVFKLLTNHINSRQDGVVAQNAEEILEAVRGFMGVEFGRSGSLSLPAPPTLHQLREEGYLRTGSPKSALLKEAPKIVTFIEEISLGGGKGKFLNLALILKPGPTVTEPRLKKIISEIDEDTLDAGYVKDGFYVAKHGKETPVESIASRIGVSPEEGTLVVISETPLEASMAGGSKHVDLVMDRGALNAALGSELERILALHENRLRDRLANFDFNAHNPPKNLKIQEAYSSTKTERVFDIPMHVCPEDSIATINVYDREGFASSDHAHDGYRKIGSQIQDARSLNHGAIMPMPFRFNLLEADGTLEYYLHIPQDRIRRFFTAFHSKIQPKRHSTYMSRLGSLTDYGDVEGLPSDNPYFRLPPAPAASEGLAHPLEGSAMMAGRVGALPRGALLSQKADGSGWRLKRFYREDGGGGLGLNPAVFTARVRSAQQSDDQEICWPALLEDGVICSTGWETKDYQIGSAQVRRDADGGSQWTYQYGVPSERSWRSVSYCSRTMQRRADVLALASFRIEKALPGGARTLHTGGSVRRFGLSCEWVRKQNVQLARKCVADYASYARKNPLLLKLRRPTS